MSRISSPGLDNLASTSRSQDLREVDVQQFLNLLIAELQNQDPLNPMSNQEMLQQIGQIREISSTNKLTDTLASVLEGQNFSTASGLIGRRISALSDDGRNIEGVVDRVAIDQAGNDLTTRKLRIHLGDQSVQLTNVRSVVSAD